LSEQDTNGQETEVSKEPAMTSYFLSPARIALVVGLIAVGGSAADAGNFGGNLNVRTSAQSLPQTVFVAGRHSHVGLGTTTTPPPYYYGGQPRRVHEFDRNTQFNGMTDTSASGKWVK
jgi:hypothetical protein